MRWCSSSRAPAGCCRPDSGRVEVLATGLDTPVGVAIAPDGTPWSAEAGAGRVVTLSGRRPQPCWTDWAGPHGISGPRRNALRRRCRRQGTDRGRPGTGQTATTHRLRPAGRCAPRSHTQATAGHAAVLRPAGSVHRYRGRTRRHALRLGRRRGQRAGDSPAELTMSEPTRGSPLHPGRPRAAQGDRRRRVSRRFASCPPNTNCVNGSRSAGIPCARRCAGCGRTTSSPRARGQEPWWSRGRRRTPMCRTSCRSTTCSPSPRAPSSRSSRSRWSPSTRAGRSNRPAPRRGMACGGGASGRPTALRCPDLPHRVLHQPVLRGGGPDAAEPHRPDLPAHRGPVRHQHRGGAPGDRRGADLTRTRRLAQGRARHPRVADAADLHHVGLGDRPGHREHPSRRPGSAIR